MSGRSTEQLRELIPGLKADFDAASPEQQALMRRDFMLTLTYGLMLAIQPSADDGEVVDPAKVEVRERIRDRIRQHMTDEDTDESLLAVLRAAQGITVEEYEDLAAIDPTFVPECELACAVHHWLDTCPDIVDEGFAKDVLVRIKL